MSKLAKKLNEAGISANSTKKASKSDMLMMEDAPKAVVQAAAIFRKNQVIKEDAEAAMKSSAEEIRGYAIEVALENEEFTNFVVPSPEGPVSVICKEQYSALKGEEEYESACAYLKKKGLDPAKHIEQQNKLSFLFDEMTEKEQDQLIGFLKKTLSEERMAKVLEQKTEYKFTNFTQQMAKVAKNADELNELRQVSHHHAFTVTDYKKKG